MPTVLGPNVKLFIQDEFTGSLIECQSCIVEFGSEYFGMEWDASGPYAQELLDLYYTPSLPAYLCHRSRFSSFS